MPSLSARDASAARMTRLTVKTDERECVLPAWQEPAHLTRTLEYPLTSCTPIGPNLDDRSCAVPMGDSVWVRRLER